MEKKRKKEIDKEEEKLRQRDGRKRPAWRDDEDSGGDEPDEVRNRDWGRRGDSSSRHSRSSRLLGHLKSSSPESVSEIQYGGGGEAGQLFIFVAVMQLLL